MKQCRGIIDFMESAVIPRVVDIVLAATAVHETFTAAMKEDGLPPNHCIIGTRVLLEVAEWAGIPARPMCIAIGAFPRSSHDLWWKGVPIPEWPEGEACSLAYPGGSTKEKFQGHVVAVLDDTYLIDVTARQFNEPRRGINIPDHPVIFKLPEPWNEKHPASILFPDGDDWDSCLDYWPVDSTDLPITDWDNYTWTRQWNVLYRKPAADSIRRLKQLRKQAASAA